MEQAIDLMNSDELTRIRGDRDEAGFGALSTERGALPLAAMSVNARVVGLVAHVELEQTFVNSADAPIEAVYIFPLPDRAAVSRFRMEVGGRVIDGVIKERGQARREYAEAIATGHRAAITEEDRPGVFTMQVGNLMPGDRAVVRLDMTGPVPIEEGDATFRFPLVVAPRYIPGKPLPDSVGDGVAGDTDAVPDASRITPPVLLPGFPNPVRLRIALSIDPAGMPMSNLRSSLHSIIDNSSGSAGVRRIALQPGERLDRDFIVRYRLGDDAVRTSLVLAPDSLARGADSSDGAGTDRGPGSPGSSDDSAGTFLLTMVPPVDLGDAQKPRDVVFVLDRSGSMGGWKMVAARRAVARMIDTLTDADRFLLLAFDHTVESPPTLDSQALTPATDRNRFRAVEFLARLDSRGGTEMARPLSIGADSLAGGYADRDRVLVLVTDGQVGNEDQILRGLKNRLKNVRVFTLGIDQAVNAGFLQRLAGMGGGSCALVESEDRLDEVMDGVHRRIATPVITELSLQENNGLRIESGTVVPGRLPDLFAGAPITITGRYTSGAGGIQLSGQRGDGMSWREQVASKISGDRETAEAIMKMWARGQVRELEDRYATSPGNTELQQRIVRTSLEYSVLCRFTAFLAVDRSERVNPGGEPSKVVQPVEAPAGWDMMGAAAPSGMRTRAGVAMSGGGFPPPPPSPASPAPMMASLPDEFETRVRIEAQARLEQQRHKEEMRLRESPMDQKPRVESPQAPKRRSGLLSRIGDMFSGGDGSGKSALPSTPPVSHDQAPGKADMAEEFAPYIDRLRQVREHLDSDLQAGVSDATSRLGALITRLRMLVEDLSSVNGPADVLDRLRDLIDALKQAVNQDEHAAMAALRQAMVTMDELLARSWTGGTGGPAPARREFWK